MINPGFGTDQSASISRNAVPGNRRRAMRPHTEEISLSTKETRPGTQHAAVRKQLFSETGARTIEGSVLLDFRRGASRSNSVSTVGAVYDRLLCLRFEIVGAHRPPTNA